MRVFVHRQRDMLPSVASHVSQWLRRLPEKGETVTCVRIFDFVPPDIDTVGYRVFLRTASTLIALRFRQRKDASVWVSQGT